MTDLEFKLQTFKTPEQWASGLSDRLEPAAEGGITLYPMPTFTQWIKQVNGVKKPAGIAVNGCGQIYFFDTADCLLYRYDPNPKLQRLEKISCVGGCDADSGKFKNPGRIIIDKFNIWVLDAGNKRIQVLSRDNYQIKYLIEGIEEPVDIALDNDRNLYVLDILDNGSAKIFKYDHHGWPTDNKGFEAPDLKQPIGMAIGKGNSIYVIDGGSTGFLMFTDKGEYKGIVGTFPKDFQASHIVIDKKGSIFVSNGKTASIIQFDADGSHVGTIEIPDFTGAILGLAVDVKGNLYVSTEKGIAFLNTEQRFAKEGVYYSKALDSGINECQWHRLALEVNLPPKTVMKIFYHASDDPLLKKTTDEILARVNQSIQKKIAELEHHLPWSEHKPTNPEDMLFQEKTGRYLWLKVVLSTFDKTVRPSVKAMKIYYPRISYLRYLPAIYQEDPASKDFLERFLSLFETVFHDLETDIGHLHQFFDPDTRPERLFKYFEAEDQKFLQWLASWMNIALEESWPEEKQRQLIKEAHRIYKSKGTPAGLSRLINIYIGKEPVIVEAAKVGKPLVLDNDFSTGMKLGFNSLLTGTPIRGFLLGDDSILGRVALRDEAMAQEDPFLAIAHRFTVIVDLSNEEFKRYETGLRRILEEEKPAHTAYSLRKADQMRVGVNTYVGINTTADDYRPMRINVDSVLGKNLVVFDPDEEGGKVERHSKLGIDTHLI